jgi:hypothetical protein
MGFQTLRYEKQDLQDCIAVQLEESQTFRMKIPLTSSVSKSKRSEKPVEAVIAVRFCLILACIYLKMEMICSTETSGFLRNK